MFSVWEPAHVERKQIDDRVERRIDGGIDPTAIAAFAAAMNVRARWFPVRAFADGPAEQIDRDGREQLSLPTEESIRYNDVAHDAQLSASWGTPRPSPSWT